MIMIHRGRDSVNVNSRDCLAEALISWATGRNLGRTRSFRTISVEYHYLQHLRTSDKVKADFFMFTFK